jgi:hypothetical protein
MENNMKIKTSELLKLAILTAFVLPIAASEMAEARNKSGVLRPDPPEVYKTKAQCEAQRGKKPGGCIPSTERNKTGWIIVTD